MSNRLPIIAVIAAIVLFVFYSSIFVVNPREQAIVLRFGEIVDVKSEPGIGPRVPGVLHPKRRRHSRVPETIGEIEGPAGVCRKKKGVEIAGSGSRPKGIHTYELDDHLYPDIEQLPLDHQSHSLIEGILVIDEAPEREALAQLSLACR